MAKSAKHEIVTIAELKTVEGYEKKGGIYLGSVSINVRPQSRKLYLDPNDDGSMDANDPKAIHAAMVELEKAKKGIYVISPSDPEARGGVIELKKGFGGAPYLYHGTAASRKTVTKEVLVK